MALPVILTMRKTLLLITFVFVSTLLNGQNLTLETLISIAETKTNLDTDTLRLCEMYVLDGIPYTTTSRFEKELEKYTRDDIKLAAIADLSNSKIYCRMCDYVLLIGTSQNQSRKYKLEQLELIRSNLTEKLPELVITDFNCEDCRQLVVDGNPIEAFRARELVNELKPKEIQFIVSYQTANPEIYGSNAINGVTEIFLK